MWRRDSHRRPDGQGRRPRGGACRQAATAATNDVRDVRERRRCYQSIGGAVTHTFGFMIESMVAILLLLTILYCVRLSKQLRLLRADEQSLRATIAELVTATGIAERAIGGLKSTMRDGEQSLNTTLNQAQQASADIEQQLAAGRDLLAKLARIIGAAKPTELTEAPAAREVAAAAQAFADRARARGSGLAA